MRAGSLFSGIGGLDYGLHLAGFEHVFFCEGGGDPAGTRAEREQWAQGKWRRSILAHHWPGVPIYTDVRDVGVEPTPRAAADGRGAGVDGAGRVHANPVLDLVCGGSPCQDVSVAGQRRGLAGARSGLFFEFARVVDAFRPGWVLLENVPGLLSSNGGRDFGVVLGTLADLGYGVGWRVLDSRFFGVPQRRRRVFVVGARADGDSAAAAQRAGQVLAVGTCCPGHSRARGEARTDIAVASLSGLGSGGPDDNDEQAGRVIASTVRSHPRAGSASPGLGIEETLVAHALTSAGHDASEDGSGRGTPLVAATLTSGGHPTGRPPGRRKEDDINLVAGTLGGGNHGAGRRTQDDPNLVMQAGVRRLTPVECERLQGLPDNWTNPTGSESDGRRYSGLGDAVTATVAYWIGLRLRTTRWRPANAATATNPLPQGGTP